MKKYFTLLLLIFSSLISLSQTRLQNTKWKIHTEVPRSADLQYEFRKDTLVIYTEEGVENQRMLFSQNQDTLYVKKLSGSSPCPIGSEGWYTVLWQNNDQSFSLKLIKDECGPRVNRSTNMKVLQKIN